MTLSSNDLLKVLKVLISAQNQWYYLGLAFGLQPTTLDSIKGQNDSTKDCLREMLKVWLKRTNPKPSWRAVVEGLRDVTVEENQLAEEVEKKYCPTTSVEEPPSHVAPKREDQDNYPTSTSQPGGPLGILSQTIESLKHLMKMKLKSGRKAGVVEDIISDFVVTSIQSGMSQEQVQAQLQRLHKQELLITEDVLREAERLAAEEYVKHTPTTTTAKHSADSAGELCTPLFCKDTIYHASICSRVVSTCEAGDYQKFFKNKELVPGHSFRAVSLSRSKQNPFLIAQMGESTYYFAFKGEPNLLQWAKQFKSFSEGIMAQSEQFPIRFIIELLNKQCRIVLTGFSFGGLLACAVAARVWDSPYISSDLLKDNMVCITFGQPLVSVQVIQRVVRRRPEIVSTLHAVYLEEDLVPSVMSLLDESWSASESQSKNTSGVHVSLLPEHKAPFLDPTTSILLNKLRKIQTPQDSSVKLDLCELKAKIKELVPKVKDRLDQCPQSITSYLIACEREAGLKWSKLTGNQRTILTLEKTEQLDASLYEKHSIKEYSSGLFVGHLDKPPKYEFPPSPKHAPGDVDGLRPSIDEVHIHHHGNETATVIEGSNLWFCYQISFCGHTIATPVQEISGSSIQFNVPRERQEKSSANERKERVSLHTHFSSKPIKTNEVPVFEKGYSIKTRQRQLARCSPSQVIELAYLSALLEQHPDTSSEPPSHKLQVITKFLEEVVKVVPFESISYAIANCSYENAVLCYDVMMNCGIDLPKSELMLYGLENARRRMQFGYPGRCFGLMVLEAQQNIGIVRSRGMFNDIEVDESHGLINFTTRAAFNISGIIIPSGPETTGTIDVKHFTRGQTNEKIQDNLFELCKKLYASPISEIVCSLNIEHIYPVKCEILETLKESSQLTSPLHILTNGHKKLSMLASKAQDELVSSRVKKTKNCNQQMLKTVNNIKNKDIDLCTSLLGGFMDQQDVSICLQRPQKATSDEVSLYATASVGVWALFSLDYSHVQPLLAKCRGDQLLVKIIDYVQSISGVLPSADDSDRGPYAAKLQFVVQGMTKTVTCNTQLISYSLERQLVELCRERNIDAAMPLATLTREWSKLFKETTLSLVAERHHPLIARWLKWALMIHNLREELAKYTAIGVAGLVNSGKSKIVNTLFGIKVPTGTTEVKRTTVPFLYNLDESVEGLNVVDFPGVDDEDDTIGELADLLLTIAQIVLFVVDYRKVHTQSAKKWLERLQKEEVPVLVCLTFGDKLYAEHMTKKREHPNQDHMKRMIKEQLSVIEDKLGRPSHSHKTQFFSFSQDNDSILNSDEGREKLKDVGIESPSDVGEWLVRVFRKDFGQDELADQLEPFLHENILKVIHLDLVLVCTGSCRYIVVLLVLLE